MPSLEIGSDNMLRVLALRNSETLAFINDATVTATLLDAIGGTEQTVQTWPLTLNYRDVSASDVGGEAALRTLVKSVDGNFDLTLTVGSTNNLTLAAGDFVWFYHWEYLIWQVRGAITANAGADVTLHVIPFLAATDKLPTKVSPKFVGEPIELVDGTYQGLLQDTLVLVDGTKYVATVDIDDTTGALQKTMHLGK